MCCCHGRSYLWPKPALKLPAGKGVGGGDYVNYLHIWYCFGGPKATLVLGS